MRVIAGKLGGRSFESPKGHRTHPMSDKVRGALFNMLGDISGLAVLDAYAGSGALSFEAISRGAERCVAVDSDTSACQAIVQNLRQLGIGNRVKVVRQNIVSWSRDNTSETFDIVLADPPYDDIKPAYLSQVARHVKPGGLFILSWPGRNEVPVFDGLTLVAHKSYGDAQLCVYRG
jgi:16S rRNA (guanine966-N2)-methyltransferase